MKTVAMRWLSEDEIWRERLLGPKKSREGVSRYLKDHLLHLHPLCKEDEDGVTRYGEELFKPDSIVRWRRSRRFRDHARKLGLIAPLKKTRKVGSKRKPDGEWLTAREIWQAQLLGVGKSLRAVTLYIQRYRLSAMPGLCRVAKHSGNTLEYHASLFTPEKVAERCKNRAGYESHPPRGIALLSSAEGRALLSEMRLHGGWLTAREIWQAQLLGAQKSLNAVQRYIQRYHLSDSPDFCRVAAHRRNVLEYHVSLFTPEKIAERRKYRAGREAHPPRGISTLDQAAEGALANELAMLSLRALPSWEQAADIREKCIARFGLSIMKDTDPNERVKIPSVRVFHYWLINAYQKKRESKNTARKARKQVPHA